MNWARRLKRVFGIEIEQCVRCGGCLQVIASIEEPQVISPLLASFALSPFGLEARRRDPLPEPRGDPHEVTLEPAHHRHQCRRTDNADAEQQQHDHDVP
jgi:hypothetical protein